MLVVRACRGCGVQRAYRREKAPSRDSFCSLACRVTFRTYKAEVAVITDGYLVACKSLSELGYDADDVRAEAALILFDQPDVKPLEFTTLLKAHLPFCRPVRRTLNAGEAAEPVPPMRVAPNVVPLEKRIRILTMLNEAHSIRRIARDVGVSTPTVWRYAKEFGRAQFCACGAAATHKGWCRWRLSQSPTRIKWLDAHWGATFDPSGGWLPLASRRRASAQPLARFYPYRADGMDDDTRALLQALDRAVPRYLTNDARADVCQDVLLAIYEGRETPETAPLNVKAYVSAFLRMFKDRFRTLSIDVPIFEDGPMRSERLEDHGAMRAFDDVFNGIRVS